VSSTVTVEDLRQVIDSIIKASEKGIKVPIAVHGTHGIGKTEIIKQLVESAGYNFVVLHLSTQEVGDLIGLPYKIPDPYNPGAEISMFAKPEFLANASEFEKTVFFLDEMNRAEPYVLQTMLPFALEGVLHTHKIKPLDIIISAMNPDTANYNVTTISDKALLSRFMHLYLEPTGSEWLSHLTSRGDIHPAVIKAMSAHTDVSDIHVPHKDRVPVSMDRRSVTKIGQLLHILDRKTVLGIGSIMCRGMIDVETANVIMSEYRNSIIPTFEDILDGKVFTNGLNFKSDIDVLTILNQQLAVYLYNARHVSDAYITNISHYLDKLPQDTAVAVIRLMRQTFGERGRNDMFELFERIDVVLGESFTVKSNLNLASK
jgi:hypothetical protein